jgi:superfamily II DNA or RNA helicase
LQWASWPASIGRAATRTTRTPEKGARTGNWFLETNLVIARLDKLSRNEDVQEKLKAPDGRWDLIVCDEAHKMSARAFGGEITYTKRYKLGQLLSTLTRHFLLMTATPHNGKEEDFQLFLALLDGDRFEGRFRDGVHQVEVSDAANGESSKIDCTVYKSSKDNHQPRREPSPIVKCATAFG